jgi:RecJ-like exonuclease
MNIKEKVAEILEHKIRLECPQLHTTCMPYIENEDEIAEAIHKLYEAEGYVLNRKVCPECKGHGTANNPPYKINIICKTCNGTGHVSRYVELCENQEVPELSEDFRASMNDREDYMYQSGFSTATKRFATPHTEDGVTTKWVKVIVPEEKWKINDLPINTGVFKIDNINS